jgi:hypothetical protein
MKPSQEQLTAIEDILGNASKYRETYEELYDHILSALETVPDDVPFIGALYNIVENGLGGKSGISLIEEKYRKVAVKEIAKKYLTYFGRYLISPLILVIIAGTALLYWVLVMVQSPTAHFLLMIMIMNIGYLPLRFRRYEVAKAQRLGYHGKSSIVSIAYPVFRYAPVYFYAVIGLCYFLVNVRANPNTLTAPIISTIFFISTVNALTFYRLCKDEFEVITTT